MKIWYVVKNYFTYTRRIPTSFIMMIIFPIILITILGTALKGEFDKKTTFNKIEIEYKLDSRENNFNKSFCDYIKLLEDKLGIKSKEVDNVETSKNKVKNMEITAFLNVINTKEIELYSNNKDEINTSMLKSLLNYFVDKNRIVEAILNVNPKLMENVKFIENQKYIDTTSITGKEKPSSIDYYSIATMVQMGLYASIAATFSVYSQKKNDVLKRIGLSGIGTGKFMTGTIFGNIIVGFIELLVIYAYSVAVLKANWGNNLVPIALLFASLLFFSSSIGVSIGVSVKNEVIAAMIPQIMIPFFAFTGGAYFPIELGILSYVSPIYWTNKAVNSVVFSGDKNVILIAFIVNIVIGIIFHIFAIVKTRKVVFS